MIKLFHLGSVTRLGGSLTSATEHVMDNPYIILIVPCYVIVFTSETMLPASTVTPRWYTVIHTNLIEPCLFTLRCLMLLEHIGALKKLKKRNSKIVFNFWRYVILFLSSQCGYLWYEAVHILPLMYILFIIFHDSLKSIDLNPKSMKLRRERELSRHIKMRLSVETVRRRKNFAVVKKKLSLSV